ncbi:MAG: hypothetical protein MJ248_04680 [Bacilli bacterium]|nr:hypothetical protein [Bacilli bacterium]
MARKVASKDFNKNSLPRNRKEQFFDIIKNRQMEFFKVGALLLLFFIPFLVSIIIKDVSVLSITSMESVTEEEIASMIFSTNIIYNAMMFVSIIIFSIGLSGIIKIFKELIYSEPIFFKEDFFQGIKENIKSLVVISVIVGLLTAISNIAYIIFDNIALRVLPTAINFALIFPACLIAIFLTSIYNNKAFVTIKTSYALYIRYFPQILLSYVLVILMVFLKLIPIEYFFIKYIVLILAVVFYYPTIIFGSYIFQVSVYDKNFNKTQFIEYYHKGLFNEDLTDKK